MTCEVNKNRLNIEEDKIKYLILRLFKKKNIFETFKKNVSVTQQDAGGFYFLFVVTYSLNGFA